MGSARGPWAKEGTHPSFHPLIFPLEVGHSFLPLVEGSAGTEKTTTQVPAACGMCDFFLYSNSPSGQKAYFGPLFHLSIWPLILLLLFARCIFSLTRSPTPQLMQHTTHISNFHPHPHLHPSIPLLFSSLFSVCSVCDF